MVSFPSLVARGDFGIPGYIFAWIIAPSRPLRSLHLSFEAAIDLLLASQKDPRFSDWKRNAF